MPFKHIEDHKGHASGVWFSISSGDGKYLVSKSFRSLGVHDSISGYYFDTLEEARGFVKKRLGEV